MFGSRRASRPGGADSVELELPNRSGRLVYKVQQQPAAQQPSGSSSGQPPPVPKAHPRITAITAESIAGHHHHGPVGRRASSPAGGTSFGSGSGRSAALVELRGSSRQPSSPLLVRGHKNLAYSASASANLGSYPDAPPTFLRRKSSVVSSLRLVRVMIVA